MSLINKEIGEFCIQAYHNEAFKEVKKEDVLGRWSIFFFYPADFTFVCPTELEDLADKYPEFQAAGCEVYSVSCDTHYVHKAWHDASDRIKKIGYPMLADPTHVISRDFEVYIRQTAWQREGHLSSTPKERSRPMRSMREMWDATRMSCCANCRRASSYMSTAMRCARRNGSRGQRR